MLTVCTGWHPAAWEQYARTFVTTFARRWPRETDLIAYTEEAVQLPSGECRSLWSIPGATEFHARHAGNPVHCGRAPNPHWREKDKRKGYGWRWDAVRWFKQGIIPNDVAKGLPDGSILAWFDADVVTFADVPRDMVERLLGGADLCYLGRSKGSEIGFWASRLNGGTRRFLADFASVFLDDRIFGLHQWHSAFAFDHCRRTAERRGMTARNLTPNGRDHVWFQCRPLMLCTDHLKGDRKSYGHSPEHPLKWWHA